MVNFSSRDTDFPQLSICPSYLSYKQNVLDHYNISGKDVDDFKFPPKVDSAEFFKNATYSAKQLIKSISISLSNSLPNSESTTLKIDFADKTENEIKDLVSTKNWTASGRCFGYQVPDLIKKLQVHFYICT